MTEPIRTCVGCGAKHEKSALLRLARTEAGVVVWDERARLPGRGAYVCGPACAQKALSRRALDRAFKRPSAGADLGGLTGRCSAFPSGLRGGDRG